MKIIFKSNFKSRTCINVLTAFSKKKENLILFPYIFGDTFYKVNELEKNMYKNINTTILNLHNNTKNTYFNNHIIHEINDINENSKYYMKNLKIFQKNIKLFFDVNNQIINYFLNKHFGFKLPKNLVIFLSPNESVNSSKGLSFLYKNNTSFIMYSYSNTDINDYKFAVSVIMHEITHTLISKDKKLSKTLNSKLEEAILDCFFPNGIFIKEIFNNKLRYVLNRSEVKKEYTLILPMVKRYYEECFSGTIWAFFRKNGFKI